MRNRIPPRRANAAIGAATDTIKVCVLGSSLDFVAAVASTTMSLGQDVNGVTGTRVGVTSAGVSGCRVTGAPVTGTTVTIARASDGTVGAGVMA